MTPNQPARIAAFLLLLNVGCAPVQTRFEIESFKDPTSPERFQEAFEDGYFTVDARGTCTFMFEIPPTYVAAPTTQPDEQPIRTSQLLRIEMMWQPRPGDTFAESSQTNANIRYCLTTGKNSISYDGAGFVSCTRSRDGQTITGTVESSSLQPAQFRNDPRDLFGPCRLTGTFSATLNRAKLIELTQRMRKSIGSK